MTRLSSSKRSLAGSTPSDKTRKKRSTQADPLLQALQELMAERTGK